QSLSGRRSNQRHLGPVASEGRRTRASGRARSLRSPIPSEAEPRTTSFFRRFMRVWRSFVAIWGIGGAALLGACAGETGEANATASAMLDSVSAAPTVDSLPAPPPAPAPRAQAPPLIRGLYLNA